MSDKSGFERGEFLQLLEALALAPGLPGREGARTGVLVKHLAARGVPVRVDRAGNAWVDAGGDGPWRETVVFDAHLVTRCRPGGRKKSSAPATAWSGRASPTTSPRSPCSRCSPPGDGANPGDPGTRWRSSSAPARRAWAISRACAGWSGTGREPPRLFIAWESDPERYSFHALGSRRYRLSVRGPGGHSWGNFGVPSAAGELINMLAGIRSAYRRAAHGLASPTSYNLGTVRGGEGINQVARAAEATFEFRSADPACLARMEKMAQSRPALKKPPREIIASLELIGERPAARATDTGALEAALRKIWHQFSLDPRECVRSTNTNIPLAAGWTCACLGLCRGGNTHRPDEYLELSSLETGWQLLERFAAELAG